MKQDGEPPNQVGWHVSHRPEAVPEQSIMNYLAVTVSSNLWMPMIARIFYIRLSNPYD